MAHRILISGAGIAGPALACWLTDAGWDVTVVERDPELRDDENVPRGEAVGAYFEREVQPHVPDA